MLFLAQILKRVVIANSYHQLELLVQSAHLYIKLAQLFCVNSLCNQEFSGIEHMISQYPYLG